MLYDAKIDLLDDILAEVESVLEENEVSPKCVIPFLVAVEEIFVNIAHYAYPDSEGKVDVNLNVTDKCARITFIDSGVAFDPLAKIDPDVSKSAEDRPIGGLGIYMVKKSMDGITYKREDDKNILEFWKNY